MDCILSEEQLVAKFAKLRHAILENIQELLLRLFIHFVSWQFRLTKEH